MSSFTWTIIAVRDASSFLEQIVSILCSLSGRGGGLRDDQHLCVGFAAVKETTNFEVLGNHIGLTFNHQVYKLIAERLAGK
ncbi:MAG: hypothetical protein M3X11_17625 [Acidobacteriota bacterium]|nr:hypothetical protein [Acidobacteriota bacterium]